MKATSGRSWSRFGAVLALVAITVALYSPVRRYGFCNLDDPSYVMENSHVLAGISWSGLKWAFTHTVEGNWHPLTMLSLMLDASLFGAGPGGFHVTNVILHILDTILLLIFLETVTGAFWRSLFVAALFAWHPMHVEPVAWLSSRKDVLSTVFFFCVLLSYAAYARKPRRSTYLLVMFLFVLGLMAKPMLITLPALLLVLDYWPLGRWHRGQSIDPGMDPVALPRLILEKLPLLAISVIFSVVAFIAQGKAVTSLKEIPLGMRMANVPLSYGRYLRKLLWPDDLAIFYPLPQTIRPLLVMASICLLVAITIAVLGMATRRPYLLTSWLWYLGTLVPVIGFVQLGGQAIADRYTYVSFVGLFIAAAWVIPRTKTPRLTGWVSVAAIVVLAGCVKASASQLGYWRSNIALFRRDLEVTESNSLAHYNLALAYTAASDPQHAIEHYEATVAVSPRLPTAWNNLGIAYFLIGRLDKAADQFEMALRIDPRMADAHNNLGNIFFVQNRLDEAIEQYEAALKLDPHHGRAEESLRRALAARKGIERTD